MINTQARTLRQTLAAVTIGLSAGIAAGVTHAADCDAPEMPGALDGSTASMEEMLAGQKAVKAFQAANTDYMQCLEKNFQAAEENAKESADAAARAIAQKEYADSVEAYNAAVSAEEEVAGAFNIALRAYKAAHGK